MLGTPESRYNVMINHHGAVAAFMFGNSRNSWTGRLALTSEEAGHWTVSANQ